LVLTAANVSRCLLKYVKDMLSVHEVIERPAQKISTGAAKSLCQWGGERKSPPGGEGFVF